MTTIFREYRVHHSSADGILVQLPGNSGFGRLTKEALGGDALAERLLKSFSARDHIPAILRRARDVQGYRLLSVELSEGWSDVLCYPQPVRRLVPQLLRKHLLVGLGTTTAARVVKQGEKGIVLSMAANTTAVAAFEKLDGAHASGAGASTAEVRVLNYDVSANVVNVTLKEQVIERTPLDTTVASSIIASISPGSTVKALVLLSSTDDGCAVVEIPVTTPKGETCSVLGYYIYAWSAQETSEAPVVGTTLDLRVEFSPELPMLQEMMPFVVLSNRQSFMSLPAVRRHTEPTAAAAGMLGYLLWRGDAMQAAGDDSDDDGEHGESGQPRMRRRKLEEAIDAYERAMDHTTPTSPEEFQRLLMGSPNSSYLWTQYIAFHVGLQQMEEARQVAEKALTTIGVREAEERLNVWVAYLNIENLHGTAESLASVFKRAASRQLDPFVLHERLADIFHASRKSNQLLALCRTMTSKFRNERRAWERLGICLVDQDKRDQLKRVIKDMSDALKKDEAAMTVVRIGIHEYKHGTSENGRALFEGLLAKAPKKSDVWSAYVDQELGLLNRRAAESSVTHVRNVLERAVAMNFPAKVMHQFLTRFLGFEKAFGTPADVEKVKERARAYVDSKIQAVTDTGVNA